MYILWCREKLINFVFLRKLQFTKYHKFIAGIFKIDSIGSDAENYKQKV